MDNMASTMLTRSWFKINCHTIVYNVVIYIKYLKSTSSILKDQVPVASIDVSCAGSVCTQDTYVGVYKLLQAQRTE